MRSSLIPDESKRQNGRIKITGGEIQENAGVYTGRQINLNNGLSKTGKYIQNGRINQ